MIRCIAVDDEPLALKQIEHYASQVPYIDLVACCNNAARAFEVIAENDIDAVFVDINMPDLSGLEFIKQLAAPPLVVFTTAYENYALDGFKVGAVDYLLKPFNLEEFRQACAKLLDRLKLNNREEHGENTDYIVDDEIYIKADYKIVRIDVENIHYVEAMSEYLKIHMIDGQRPVTVLMSMKKIEERLPSNRFMRIHRSYIINLRCIREVNKNHVDIGTQNSLPIGDLYKDNFLAHVNRRFLSK